MYLAFYLMCFTTLNLWVTRYVYISTLSKLQVWRVVCVIAYRLICGGGGIPSPIAGSCWFSHINVTSRGLQLGFAYSAPDVFILIGRRFSSFVYFASRHSPSIPSWNQCLIQPRT